MNALEQPQRDDDKVEEEKEKEGEVEGVRNGTERCRK